MARWLLVLPLLAGAAWAQGGDSSTIEPFGQAVFGQDSAKIDGNGLVNSFAPGDPPTFSDDAVVRSNGDVTLEGNGKIGGHAVAGDEVVQKGSKTEITGSITEDADPLAFPALTEWIAGRADDNDNASIPAGFLKDGKLEVKSGETLTLAPGDYFFSEIDVKGTLAVTDGEVRLFVTGTTDVTGSMNPDGDPGNLWLFSSTVKDNGVKLSGKAEGWFVAYAMSGEVQVTGDATVWGAITAKSVQISGNGAVHYHPSLAGLSFEVDVETGDPGKEFK